MARLTTTSAGHHLADVKHLDNHYIVAQPEYEDTLRSVGIEAGWHVLDAGCGGGSFLPLMATLVGKTGKIVAMDLAPENIKNIQAMAETEGFICELTTEVGSVTSLPFAENQFDCVWCANVVQYLTEEQFQQAVAEFKRVVKPGGTIAIKDVDISAWQFQPMEPPLMWNWITSWNQTNSRGEKILGGMIGTRIPTWLREAGIKDIQRKGWLVERWAPIDALTRGYLIDNLRFLAGKAEERDLPPEDREQWRAIVENPAAIVDHPDLCYRELYVLTTGVVNK